MLFRSVTSSLLFAQTNGVTRISTVQPSEWIVNQLSNFETNVSVFETNIIREPDKSSDESLHEQAVALQPLKDALQALRVPKERSKMDRRSQAVLWLKVLAAIDRHLETNIPSVSISGFISPPPGYKGKVGINGMLRPDTNDTNAYTYYMAAVKANKVKAKKALYLHELEGINDIDAKSGIEQFLKSNYASSGSDKQEFEELLNQSSLSDARKQKLRDLFKETH